MIVSILRRLAHASGKALDSRAKPRAEKLSEQVITRDAAPNRSARDHGAAQAARRPDVKTPAKKSNSKALPAKPKAAKATKAAAKPVAKKTATKKVAAKKSAAAGSKALETDSAAD